MLTSRRLLLGTVALFLANGILLRRSTQHLSENFGWVAHTLQVQSAVYQVAPDLIAFNRFIRSNWTAQEHPSSQAGAAAELLRDADQIQRLTVDNSSQQMHAQQLKALLAAHLAMRGGTPPVPLDANLEQRLAQDTQRITALLSERDAEEVKLLQQRPNQASFTEQRLKAGMLAETLGGIIFSILCFIYYRNLVRPKQEREQAECQNQAILNSVLECTSDCVLTLSRDWALVYGNRKTLESLPDFKLGTSYWECFPDIAGTPVERYLRDAMDDHQPVNFENYYAHYGRWYRVQIFPFDAGLNIFFSDISAEKKMLHQLELDQSLQGKRIEELSLMTAELARVNEVLTSVNDSTSDGIIKIDRSWLILYGNRVAKNSLADFKLGVGFWSCFPALLSTHAEKQLLTAMNDRVVTQYDIFYAPYSGWYRVHVFPTVGGISLFFSIITAEKKLQSQLEHEQLLREKRIEALSHMAGGLAHEISNPLAIIHGRATDLRDMAAGEAPLAALEVRETCDDILKTANRASAILRGLRGFGREASKDPMQLASIYDIAGEIVELQQVRFERHAVDLRLRLDPDVPLLLCRETQIGQILTNLLNNAFDAVVQSESVVRWVEMTATGHDGNIVVEVSDSGPGIEDHFKAHLMEPFFTTKELSMGMGVGLSLSRAIAQDHGGTLTLCDAKENTTFRLVLPIVHDTGNGAVEPALAEVCD